MTYKEQIKENIKDKITICETEDRNLNKYSVVGHYLVTTSDGKKYKAKHFVSNFDRPLNN